MGPETSEQTDESLMRLEQSVLGYLAGRVGQGDQQAADALSYIAALKEALCDRDKNHAQAMGIALADRDEADRRAGAAERLRAYAEDTTARRQAWLKKAKAEAGYEDGVSFDRVWDETLARAKANGA